VVCGVHHIKPSHIPQNLCQNRYRQTITNNFGLNFLQLNLHHCMSTAFNLRRIIDEDNTDIAMLQEPWVYKLGTNLELGRKNLEHVFMSQKTFTFIVCCLFQISQVGLRPTYSCCKSTATGIRLLFLLNICCSVYLPYDSLTPPPGEITRGAVLIRIVELQLYWNILLILT
jgi:hypothetical protein